MDLGKTYFISKCKIKIGSSFLLHIEITCKRMSITAKLGEGIICCTQVLIVHYSPKHIVCVLGGGGGEPLLILFFV